MSKNKKTKIPVQRIVAGAIAGVLAFAMLLSLIITAFTALAVTQKDIDRLKNNLSQATDQKKNLEKKLVALKGDKSEILEEIEALDAQVEAAQHEIECQQQLIDQLQTMIEEKTLELAASQAKEEGQYAKMLERIRFMVERGDMSYLEILLSSKDFSDFLYRYEIISQISTYEKDLFEELKAAKDTVAQQKLELETSMAQQKTLMGEMESNKNTLAGTLSAQQKKMRSIENAEDATLESYKKIEQEEERLQKEVKKKIAELAAQSTYVGGTFMWPLPAANNVVTCVYGMRRHPITRVYKLHTGVDLRGSTGTKIYAAQGGTVITSGYNSAYGNYVVINHGGGVATLYGHMSRRNVKANKKVKRGDVIGYVGSTGYSTGPHLHFEVIRNGNTSDPLKEFKNFKVIID